MYFKEDNQVKFIVHPMFLLSFIFFSYKKKIIYILLDSSFVFENDLCHVCGFVAFIFGLNNTSKYRI